MSKPAPNFARHFVCGLLFSSVFLAGCDLLTVSQTGRNVREGNEAMALGDIPMAQQKYEAALDGTMLSAEAHYRLGLLYEDKLKNEIGALHHFERYLELAPQGQFATDVKGYVDRLRLLIVSRFSDGPVMPAREAARLKNENLALKQQLAELREQAPPIRPPAPAVKPAATAVSATVAKPAPMPTGATAAPAMIVAATPRPASVPVLATEPEVRRAVPVGASAMSGTDAAPRVQPVGAAPSPAIDAAAAAGAPVRTYKVVSGDTLAGIARKLYKNSGQWQKIAEANKGTLTDPTKLKPGMVLVIP